MQNMKGMIHMRKSVKILAVASAITIMSTFTPFASWENSEQGWKYKDDSTNTYVTSTWIESASEAGLWYYVDQNGVMATNTVIDNVYYVNEAGEWRESSSSGSNQSQSSSQESGGFNWDDYFDDSNGPITGMQGSGDNMADVHGAQ